VTDINEIIFQDNGSVLSERFNDIYFDTESGFQQSEDIFIKGNNIEKNLLKANHELVIGETGFGTGLNFLLTLHHYIQLSKNNNLPKLHFISTEKYPLNLIQLQQSLKNISQLQTECHELLAIYPEHPSEYIEGLFCNDKVKLTIYLEDATEAFTKLSLPKKSNGLVDAWYLDGFSPDKNPDLWTYDLFQQLARLSKPQASLSTFTVSGTIRRGLEDVGFKLQKVTYQGSKNETLIGKYQQKKLNGKGYYLRPTITKPQHVSIIGGGIASACAAYFLTKSGIKVTLYCKDNHVAQGASSNAIGAIFPLLHQKADAISLFYQAAFNDAIEFYQDIHALGYEFSHDWCGLLEISYKDSLKKRQQEFQHLQVWPLDLIQSLNKEQASKIANIPLNHGGLFIPKSGWIAPQELVQQLLNAAKNTNRLRIETSKKIEDMEQLPDGSWQLKTNKGNIQTPIVIYCGGAEAKKLSYINQLPLTAVRGQISSMKSKGLIKNLKTVICHKGYLTPANKDIHCIGATFDKNNEDISATTEDDLQNLATLHQCLPELNQWSIDDVIAQKARLRCMTPDHLPMVGAMPDIDAHINAYSHLAKDKNWKFYQPAPTIKNLYLLTGLGARGLCTAPLLAKILTADLCNTPYPVEDDMLFNLSPNRFIIRDLIKRKVNTT